MATSQTMIELQELRRNFGSTKAVDNVSFSVDRGHVFGYIGPNGAGKTTSMRILATLDTPDDGDATIDGFSVVNDPDRARLRLGFMPDYLVTYSNVNVHEYLDFFARSYRLHGQKRKDAVDRVMSFTGLNVMAEKPTDGLSKGMKQRLSLGRAMIHDPAVLVLDEPAAGLDPRARIELREMIRKLAREGKTVLISSHILTELAEMCDTVGIIERGQLLAVGTVEQIQNDHNQKTKAQVTVGVLENTIGLVDWLGKRTDLAELHHDGQHIRFVHSGNPDVEATILREMIEANFRIFSFGAKRQTLEDVFMKVTEACPMSTEGNAITLDGVPSGRPCESTRLSRAWTSVESILEWIGDRLNPILVKETRQALKSRSFLITFSLLLLLGWGWSIMGIAWVGPGASMANCGWTMFAGYYMILAFPLLIVVPFESFRSLAAEQETRTYELLSITAMGTRQIVAGKLGSAVLQILVYLSAVSPCLGFTYLLRGIDFLSIIMVIIWLTMTSLGLSALGILMATITPRKQFQIIPMIACILGFIMAFWGSIGFTVGVMQRSSSAMFRDGGFWLINGIIFTAFVAYFALVCEASSARLSFVSDNRSTRLRVIMVVHQLLFTGWMAVPFVSEKGIPPILFVFMTLLGLHWYVMGAMMIGELPGLSSRVKRQLPRSFLGRVFYTWYYPGPGKGYALALTGLLCTLLTVVIGMMVRGINGWSFTQNYFNQLNDRILPYGVIGLSYITLFLGLGLLIMRGMRRITSVGIVMSVLVQILLVLFGVCAPMIFNLMSTHLGNTSYSLLHATNPIWTMMELGSRSTSFTYLPELLVLVPSAALLVFLLNLSCIIRELHSIRIRTPDRVIEEDAEFSAAALRKSTSFEMSDEDF